MKLDDIAGRIRHQHAAGADTASADRLIYASFPALLKTAMKTAAHRYAWCRETWRLQTGLIQDALLRGIDSDDLAERYQNPPPAHLECCIPQEAVRNGA